MVATRLIFIDVCWEPAGFTGVITVIMGRVHFIGRGIGGITTRSVGEAERSRASIQGGRNWVLRAVLIFAGGLFQTGADVGITLGLFEPRGNIGKSFVGKSGQRAKEPWHQGLRSLHIHTGRGSQRPHSWRRCGIQS